MSATRLGGYGARGVMLKPKEEEEGTVGRGQALSRTETGNPFSGSGSQTHYFSSDQGAILSESHSLDVTSMTGLHRGASSEGLSGGHGGSFCPFSCKSEVNKKHPSDPTGLRRVRHREPKNLMFTTLLEAMYRPHGFVVAGAVLVR